MVVGDVSLLKYTKICDLYRRYSSNDSRSERGTRDALNITTKNSREGIPRIDIGNLLEDFKIDILIFLSSQLDALQEMKR